MTATVVRQGTWVPVCRLDQLRVDLGVAALVGGEQVALFRLDAAQLPETPEIAAIGNFDPCSQANVLSRGIVGSRGDAVFVASPMYKQAFDLRTGRCLDDPEISVPTYTVRVVNGVVQVLAPSDTETSDPETSDPETSDTDTSNTDTSNTDTSNTDTSDTEIRK